MLGIAIVGLSNAISTTPAGDGGGDGGNGKEDVGKAVLGAGLVLFAQIFTASQFVIEEKIMTRYSLAPLVSFGPFSFILRGESVLCRLMWLFADLYYTCCFCCDVYRAESSRTGRHFRSSNDISRHATSFLPLWSFNSQWRKCHSRQRRIF